jgi:hypothetical protein
MAAFARRGSFNLALVALALAVCGCPESGPVQNGGHPTAAFFTPAQAWMGKPFYADRVAEQADSAALTDAAMQLRFHLETNAFHVNDIRADSVLGPRTDWAVPMGVYNGSLAVLTSRCEIDYAYPLHAGHPDPNFVDLALFNADKSGPRSVFMLAPVPERKELSAARDPSSANILPWHHDRAFLSGPLGDRYFGDLATNHLPRVQAALVSGAWRSDEGIDLVILYFPLADPGVTAAFGPRRTMGVQGDPMAVVQASMADKTNFLGDTFQFNMITSNCLHQAEKDFEHEQHEVKLWKGIAIVAAASVVAFVLLPELAATGGGLASLTAHMSAVESVIGPKLLNGMAPMAWHVAQRVLEGEQLNDVLWDEGGHLVLNTVIDGIPRHISLAGVHRGSATNEVANRVLDTVREFIRDRAGQLLIQYAPGHADEGSLVRPDYKVDLATELLASGLTALDTQDRPTLARQPTLIRAASFALQGNRGPAVQDPGYQTAVQQLTATAGI